MTEIRHIVFDIGKVLVHYDPDHAVQPPDPRRGRARRWFFDNVCTHAWNIEQDRGRSWEDAEALLIAEPTRTTRDNIRDFRRHWHEMVPHAYDDSVAVLQWADRQRPRRDAADQLGRRHVPRGAQALPVSRPRRAASRSRARSA